MHYLEVALVTNNQRPVLNFRVFKWGKAHIAAVSKLIHKVIHLILVWLFYLDSFWNQTWLQRVKPVQVGYLFFAQGAYITIAGPAKDALHAKNVGAGVWLGALSDLLETNWALLLVLKFSVAYWLVLDV